MIKLRYTFLLITLLSSTSLKAQTSEAELYQTAYDYLNDSILTKYYVSAEQLAQDCSRNIISKRKPEYSASLQVADRFIKINSQFPLRDFVSRNYNLSEDCLLDIRMGIGKCQDANRIRDSLNTFWSEYESKGAEQLSQMTAHLPSDRKDGFQVFFSEIYKNTLAAELKSFCLSYSSKWSWMGPSKSFYFVFNAQGKIKEVIWGTVVHYN